LTGRAVMRSWKWFVPLGFPLTTFGTKSINAFPIEVVL
jgi:hypothetical protein